MNQAQTPSQHHRIEIKTGKQKRNSKPM